MKTLPFHFEKAESARASFATMALASVWLVTSPTLFAQVNIFQEPQTPTEAQILAKLLERRLFTQAEIDAIDQVPKNGIIDVRDLVLFYKATPKPPYAFFPQESSALISVVQETGNVPVYFTRPFTGTLWYQFSGDALKDTDFQLANSETLKAGAYVGSVTVSNATTAQIPVRMAPKTKLSGAKSLVVALVTFRDVANASGRTSLPLGLTTESTAKYVGYRVRQVDTNTVWRAVSVNSTTRLATWVQESGSGYDVGPASAHRVDLHEADRGVFRANLRFYNGSGLNQQPVTIAVRSNGQAYFDTTDAKLFNGPFSVPVTFGGNGSVSFAQSTSYQSGTFSAPIGGRAVTWTLRLREQAEVTVTDEAARLALSLQSSLLSVGDRVKQSTDNSLWTLLDDRFPASKASWRPQSPESRTVTACLELANLAAQPYTACGVLECTEIEPPLLP